MAIQSTAEQFYIFLYLDKNLVDLLLQLFASVLEKIYRDRIRPCNLVASLLLEGLLTSSSVDVSTAIVINYANQDSGYIFTVIVQQIFEVFFPLDFRIVLSLSANFLSVY